MSAFNTQKEILTELVEGNTLIYSGVSTKTIFKINDGALESRDINEWIYRAPHPCFYNFLSNVADWEIYHVEKHQDYLNQLCVGKYCWVSDRDPDDQSTFVFIERYLPEIVDCPFVDNTNRSWRFAKPLDRWELVARGLYRNNNM